MTVEGVDYSYGRPGGAALAKADKHFAVRYITGDKTKPIDSAEIADLRAHGIAICLVFESTKGRALTGGYGGGATDAAASVARMATLHIPPIPVYFAVDTDTTLDDQPNIDAYLRGAASVIGLPRTGVYANNRIVDHCAQVKTAAWFWQTYAWSHGLVSDHAHLLQYRNSQSIGGAAVDFDRALQSQYGQWASPGTLPDSSTGGIVGEYGVDFAKPVPFTTNGSVKSYAGAPPHSYIGDLDGPISVVGTLAIDATTTPHGDFVTIATGTTGRRIIAAALVTPAITDCAQAIVDAKAAQHELDRTAAIAAAGTI
jgi:glycoside hydrolase-like protein